MKQTEAFEDFMITRKTHKYKGAVNDEKHQENKENIQNLRRMGL